MSFNPTRGNLLRSHVVLLADLGHKIDGWISDDYGEFACRMRDQFSGLPFIITARGNPPYHGKVAFQEKLLRIWKTIHVLSVQPQGDPSVSFWVYSGRRILAFPGDVDETQYKPGCIFVNFPAEWGEFWDPKKSLDPVWQKVKRKTPAAQSFLS